MARARNIKPAIMDNDVLAGLVPMARLLFIYMWMLADREGRLEDNPARIGVRALPYDRGADVDGMLWGLHKAGFILRYEAAGQKLIQVLAFSKHQSPHVREAASELPDASQGNVRTDAKHNLGSAEASPGSPDCGLMNDDCGMGSKTPAAEQPASPAPPATPAPPPPVKAKAKPRKTAMPADYGLSERVLKWGAKNHFDRLDEHMDSFKRKCAANAYAYADWDAAFMEAVREDWAKLRGRTPAGTAPPAEVHVGNREAERTQAELAGYALTPKQAQEGREQAARLKDFKRQLSTQLRIVV